ncbi:MAG: FkbM family methyltransferase, partial [Magnetococcales bacterium]|nr:FkbM family methyltransferase [Magnetococcales bacterium]
MGITWRELTSRSHAAIAVQTPHIPDHPIWLRLHTTDISTYIQMFVNREYAMLLAKPPQVIIDAGANIGFSAIFFAQCYPEARILALEPAAANFALLERNTRPYPNITPLHRALWGSRTTLSLHDPGPGRAGLQTDGFQTLAIDPAASPAPHTVEAIDPDSLMA